MSVFKRLDISPGRLALLMISAWVAGCSKQSEPPPAAPVLPPAVLAVHPPARTVGVAYDTDIWITFETPLDPTTVNERTVFLKLDTRRISSTITVDSDARRIRIAPREELLLRRTYTAEITSNVQSLAGGSFGETFFWQFTTNALRHLDQPLPPAGALDEPPAVGLSWRVNDGSAGAVTYEVYSGLDSVAVAAYAVTPRTSKKAWMLSTQEWPMGARVYWTVRATHDETHEVEMGPVWSFQVLPEGTPVDSLFVQATDLGFYSRRTSRWSCGGLTTGPDAVASIMRFQLDSPTLRPLKLERATLLLSPTTFQQTDPGVVVHSMDPDYGCGSSLFPTAVQQLAIGEIFENRVYCRSVLLTSHLQARVRGVPIHGFIPSTFRTVNYASVMMVLRYYRVTPRAERHDAP